MRINKLFVLSIVSLSSLVSCGYKAVVTSEDTNKGEVTYFIKDNKLVMEASPKENYLFTGWFLKDKSDNEYRFHNAMNPCVRELKEDATYQARFEDKSTQSFVFNLEEDGKGIKNHISISHYFGDDKNIVIPNTHYGYPVTTINEKTFFYCEVAETIAIPQNIKYIGKDAFSYCTNMKSITIDHELSECYAAFAGWTKDQTINIPYNCISPSGQEEYTAKTSWGWLLKPTSGSTFVSRAIDCGSDEVVIAINL